MAKIDTSKIEGYADMTAEEKLKVLEEFEYDDNAAEVQRLKNLNSKANQEAAEWKRKHKELLTEDERKKSEREDAFKDMEEELKTLRREKQVSSYQNKLLSNGYDEKLAKATAEAMADGDMEKVFANQKTFLEAHDKAYKAELMKETLNPSGGGSTEYKTKDDIMKIKDTSERQRAIAENPELFGLNIE